MNYRMIVRLLCITLRIVAVFMLPPLLLSLLRHENASAMAFLITMALLLLLSLVTALMKPRKSVLYAREGYIIVALAWGMLSVLGALPFYFSRAIPSFVDCLFETVSGFTTTGASILKDVETLPQGLLYWRSFTHWLGGMGVLVFLLAISTFSGNSSDALYIMRAESPGPQVSKLVPRTMQTARILYLIYICMTVVQVVLMLLGGVEPLEAVCISFGTAGTGGFGVRNDSMASYSPYIQWVVAVFMALFGVNFSIYYLLLMRSFKRAAKDEELHFYLLLILVVTGLIAGDVFAENGGSPVDTLRHAAFQVSSIITTTGFSTVDFDRWPQLCRALLVTLMIVGACAGSTGGGMKCSRILILLKGLRLELQRLMHPNMVKSIKMDGKTVTDDTVRSVYGFLVAYAAIAIGSVLVISIDDFSLETNLTAMFACLGNIGPGLAGVGPMSNFSGYSDLSKVVLSMDMLAGRLEIFPLLILFMPKVWTHARD